MRKSANVLVALLFVASASFAGVLPQAGVRPQAEVDADNGAAAAVRTSIPTPVSLPVNGVWHYTSCSNGTVGPDFQGGWMSIPSQDELWLVSSSEKVLFRITDAWLTGDQFEVYVNGALALTTPSVPNGGSPEIKPDLVAVPAPFTKQGKLYGAYAGAQYSHGEIVLPAGDHLINIKLIASPVTGAGLGVLAEPYHAPTPETTPKTGPGTEKETRDSWSGVKNLFR